MRIFPSVALTIALWLSCLCAFGDKKVPPPTSDYIELNNRALQSLNEGDFARAVLTGIEAIEALEASYGADHPDYLLLHTNLSVYLSRNGQHEEAIELGGVAAEMVKARFGEISPEYVDAVYSVATLHSAAGNYVRACQLLYQAKNIAEKTVGTGHPSYGVICNQLALNTFKGGDAREAIKITEAVEPLYLTLYGAKSAEYAMLLSNFSLYYRNIGEYNTALDKVDLSLGILEELGLTDSHLAGMASGNKAFVLSCLGFHDEAIDMGYTACDILENTAGVYSSDYAINLNNLAEFEQAAGNYDSALQLKEATLEINRVILGETHPDYAIILHNLSRLHSTIGHHYEALGLSVKAAELLEVTLGPDHPVYANSLHQLGLCYFGVGNIDDAIRYERQALEILEKNYGRQHPEVGAVMGQLALYTAETGDFSAASRIMEESLGIMENTVGRHSDKYAHLLDYYALLQSSLGNYQLAMSLGNQVLPILEASIGRHHVEYSEALGHLALYHYYLGDMASAIALAEEAAEVNSEIFGADSQIYGEGLGNLATYHANLGDFATAVDLAVKSNEILANTIGTSHRRYALGLQSLGTYYFRMGDFEEALAAYTQELDILEKIGYTDNIYYGMLLENMGCASMENLDYDNGIEYTRKATALYSEIIRNTFASLTAAERSAFWNTRKYWFEKTVNVLASMYPTPEMISLAYDATLLGKGLLLDSEREFSDIIMESGDPEALELFYRLQSNRRLYDRQLSISEEERELDLESLRREIYATERSLVDRSKAYGDYTRNMGISWRDVKTRLGADDIAIEFVAYKWTPDSVGEEITPDKIDYIAYVLKEGMDSPVMVRLFGGDELGGIRPSSYYTSDEVGRLVWGPLEPYMQGCHNVYFAPSGELYNIAVEWVPDYRGDGLMQDRFDFYRLSSTRQLAVVGKEREVREKAALFGGFEYGAGINVLIDDMERYPELRGRGQGGTQRQFPDLRAGVKDLPGTLEEVENISRSLSSSNITPELYTSKRGTESSFKALSGRGAGILHVATHGFYWTESEAGRHDNLGFLMPGNEDGRGYVEDRALARSGLLFTGANHALGGGAIPSDVDDGILTAREIAVMDLRSTDLVVLSACQTGVGEVTGDGVFGLQRGFKKAGVNSLLMSLWKVDDTATQMLMSRFYECFSSGIGKYEALKSAQKYVREYVAVDEAGQSFRPYGDPRFWAAFVLLDAI